MAYRSDTSVSVAVDWARHLDLIDDGLEHDVLPEEDISPAGAVDLLAEDVERERRNFMWTESGAPLPALSDADEEKLAAPPIPEPTDDELERSVASAPAAHMR